MRHKCLEVNKKKPPNHTRMDKINQNHCLGIDLGTNLAQTFITPFSKNINNRGYINCSFKWGGRHYWWGIGLKLGNISPRLQMPR